MTIIRQGIILTSMNEEYIYPINVVVNKTGLTAHVIRAWEKRYNAIEPGRTDTNRRLYREKDIYRLKLFSKLTKSGHSISTVANLTTEDLEKLVNENEEKLDTNSKREIWNKNSFLSAGMQSIEDLDEKRLEEILSLASVELSQPELIQEVLIPMIRKIGDNWKTGSLRIYQEHLASEVIKTFLANLRSGFKVEKNAPQIIIATPIGQMHELGALLAASAAISEGWRVTYLGSNLPAEEIAAAVQYSKPKALALSLVYPPDDPKINNELLKLSRHLNNGTTLFVGGHSAESYAETLAGINAHLLLDINDFRNELVKIRKK